jgi:hypothetical protein
MDHGSLVCFAIYHNLLKLTMHKLLTHLVNQKMKSNDSRGHKSVTKWHDGTVTASLYFKLKTPAKYTAAAANITNTCKGN